MSVIREMSKGGYGVILEWYAYIHGRWVKRGQKGVKKWVKNGDFGVRGSINCVKMSKFFPNLTKLPIFGPLFWPKK